MIDILFKGGVMMKKLLSALITIDNYNKLKELSEKVGVSNVNLSKMKTGKISAIRFSTLEAICDALDCQPGDILEYSPENKDTPQS